MNRVNTFTSESVSSGHPDKICDQISDAILDAHLEQDPSARVAIETAIKGHTLCLLGEITSNAEVDHEQVALGVLRDIGHSDGRWGLSLDNIDFVKDISLQSGEIAYGVDGEFTGAGDQGIMFGYACDQTESMMPAPIDFANRLMRRHAELRSTKGGYALGPDAKSQVTVSFHEGRPHFIDTVVLSTQHSDEIDLEELRRLVRAELIEPELGDYLRDDTVFHINPAGTFLSGGPVADAGLTGRKIIADTYGGYARHGGGAFSGKDPTKVDRSAAYAARQVAKHAVSKGWVRECEVQVSYAIGHALPVSIDFLNRDDSMLQKRFERDGIDLRQILSPTDIIGRLDLRRPIYRQTASGGHFGREGLSWEKEVTVVVERARPTARTTSNRGRQTGFEHINAFEAMCRLADSENWCWKIGCTTCGAIDFRKGLYELHLGRHPLGQEWRAHERVRHSAERFSDFANLAATIEGSVNVYEILCGANPANIVNSCSMPSALGYISLALLFTQRLEEERGELTRKWKPVLDNEFAMPVSLSNGKTLTWRDLRPFASGARLAND